MTETDRYRLAWQSARRRAARRQLHEREGLIFHLERQNTRLHAFAELANEAAQVSNKAWEKESAEVARLREENARLRSVPAPAEPTPLRWGLDDVEWCDDDSVVVLLSGPDREPYRLELDPEHAAALRDLLAGPDGPQRYVAEHDGIPLESYTRPAAARDHCEAHVHREWPDHNTDWIEDDEDGVAELTVWVGGEERATGYTVTAVPVTSEYDPEADE